jgi:hypothetical protein
VVTPGDATGLAIFVALYPYAGLHEYVPPPEPLRGVDAPLQIATSAPAFATVAQDVAKA